jgi:hypothetical protein
MMNALKSTVVLSEDSRIPDELLKSLNEVHNPNVGHFGVEITLQRVKDRGHSERYLREYVQRFIKSCPSCQKMSMLKYPILTSPYCTTSLYPMQRLNVDTIGPLPVGAHGHQYIMVVIDTFTRFVELYPTRGVGGVEAAEALLQHIGRWGWRNTIS